MLLLLALVHALDQFDYRSTDSIANLSIHEDCGVYQGTGITLVRCPTAFELYSTIKLAQDPHELKDLGETKTIVGVSRSMETDEREGHLTWV